MPWPNDAIGSNIGSGADMPPTGRSRADALSDGTAVYEAASAASGSSTGDIGTGAGPLEEPAAI
jgi:hypothetical protein